MLTNLIAFDLKNSARLLVPLHIALLIFTVFGRITLGSDFLMQMPDEIFALLVIFYAIMVIVVGVISSFYFIYWFYKNLFTDEGYLMHTLPVKPWQLVASKLTGLFFWQVIDGAMILLCMFILSTVDATFVRDIPYYISVFTTSLATDLRVNQGSLIVIFIVTFVVQLLRRGLAAFFCICVGQRFTKHRVLAAFIAYIILTSVLSMVATAFMSTEHSFGVPASSDQFSGGDHSGSGAWRIVFLRLHLAHQQASELRVKPTPQLFPCGTQKRRSVFS